MKRKLGVALGVWAAGLLLLVGFVALTADTAEAVKPEGTRIKDGVLLDSAGDLLVLGFNQWGYNYQAHLFNGKYCDSYRDADWCQPWVDVDLMMVWNDAWLSNMDRDGDDLLDRHYDFPSYIGSGAWLTNEQRGTNPDGTTWTYFVKIVAVPADAEKDGIIWYTADGSEIGPSIWGDFAIIQEVVNDPSTGDHGIFYLSPHTAGLGSYGPH